MLHLYDRSLSFTTKSHLPFYKKKICYWWEKVLFILFIKSDENPHDWGIKNKLNKKKKKSILYYPWPYTQFFYK